MKHNVLQGYGITKKNKKTKNNLFGMVFFNK